MRSVISTVDAIETDQPEDLSNVDLMVRFQHGVQESGAFIQRSAVPPPNVVASADANNHRHQQQQRHIGDMPAEVLLYVLRWVVSGQLDLRSLDQCASVCRGFYICARDPEIWRLACQRVWGAENARIARPSYDSWRHMYRMRARIHLHGVYISKTSYFRYGENSFQDQFYRPMHLIEYYRYVRFFADGHAYMLTTPDAPATVVPRLVANPRQQQRADLLYGTYQLGGSSNSVDGSESNHSGTVELKLRRNPNGRGAAQSLTFGRRRRASNAAAGLGGDNYDADKNHTYHIEFRIRKARVLGTPTDEEAEQQIRPSALIWTNYEIHRAVNKTESMLHNRFELKPSMYPPLVFSRVGDFHSVTSEPLA